MSVRRQIRRFSRRYDIDPRAALAVARVEGGLRRGAVGDSGTSYGPFQLHEGGALPAGRSAAWASSPAGIRYAIQRMAQSGAAGLQGRAAVASIVRNFERPADPSGEIAKALGLYRGAGGAGGGGRLPGVAVSPGGVSGSPGGLDLHAAAQAGLQSLMSGDYDPTEALGDLMAGFEPGSVLGQGISMKDVMRAGGGGVGGPGGTPVVAMAKRMLGKPYVWGGESLKEGGFDCSGLIYWAYKKLGVSLPRTAAEQLAFGKSISFKQLRPGDLVGARDGHHIVMYIGHGKVIAAPHTGTNVQIQPLSYFSGSDWRAVRVPRR
jgi:hypothetical protein